METTENFIILFFVAKILLKNWKFNCSFAQSKDVRELASLIFLLSFAAQSELNIESSCGH